MQRRPGRCRQHGRWPRKAIRSAPAPDCRKPRKSSSSISGAPMPMASGEPPAHPTSMKPQKVADRPACHGRSHIDKRVERSSTHRHQPWHGQRAHPDAVPGQPQQLARAATEQNRRQPSIKPTVAACSEAARASASKRRYAVPVASTRPHRKSRTASAVSNEKQAATICPAEDERIVPPPPRSHARACWGVARLDHANPQLASTVDLIQPGQITDVPLEHPIKQRAWRMCRRCGCATFYYAVTVSILRVPDSSGYGDKWTS